MIHQVFSIQDTKSQTFNPPFYQKNVGEATRTFSKLCNDTNSMLAQFPEDFVLHLIGSFDDDTGVLTSTIPQTIGTAAQYAKQEQSSKI